MRPAYRRRKPPGAGCDHHVAVAVLINRQLTVLGLPSFTVTVLVLPMQSFGVRVQTTAVRPSLASVSSTVLAAPGRSAAVTTGTWPEFWPAGTTSPAKLVEKPSGP
jgi:hypothetical protein